MSPVFPASFSVTTIVSPEALDSSTTTASNSTSPDILPPWQVICAWPVSGQYGPGSRYLIPRRVNTKNLLLITFDFLVRYYALVAACILARKSEWLRNACLAAGLLFPAIAAFHGIVLAAMHIDAKQGAVDMDVYGAFQLCTIGILAAPVTVRWSKTYFYDPARNLIFLWTVLILAGLLSLTVEFYRLEPVGCRDQAGNAISPSLNQSFPYEDIACSNIPCSVDDGPSSSLRQGSTNEIFLVPAPQRLTFGAATLLAAACCIPAILSMVSMWNKILEINWKRRFGPGGGSGSGNGKKYLFGAQPPRPDEEVIEGTNGATVGKMKNVNDIIRSFLSVVQIPVFVGAVLSIMVVGELNFWSESVNYQTEPVSSIGQWAPIVGTVLAALGSLYVLGMNPPPPPQPTPAGDPSVSEGGSVHHCDHCSLRQGGVNNEPRIVSRPDEVFVDSPPRDNRDSHRGRALVHDSPAPHAADSSPEMVDLGRTTSTTPHSATQTTDLQRTPSNHGASASASEEGGVGGVRSVPTPSDAGGRRKVAQMIGDLGRYMGTPAPDLFDDSEFKRGPAQDWPEIPGEATRNPDLGQIRSQYNQPRDSDTEDNVVSPPPPLGGGRGRGLRASSAWWRLGTMRWAYRSTAGRRRPVECSRCRGRGRDPVRSRELRRARIRFRWGARSKTTRRLNLQPLAMFNRRGDEILWRCPRQLVPVPHRGVAHQRTPQTL
ncbi:hypothetical protein PG997_011814 [Apiospora hydei]|uniref:Uncharacterized protein n=1 Tax=Apiospora hydei TaxID=1337664 RepID=A0ABR1V1M0_9PEZI